MKTINYLLLVFGVIFICSCTADNDDILPPTPQAKDSISLVYENNPFVFKKLHYGKLTNENRELIGFFVQSRIVIDEKHMNDILIYFKTNFKDSIVFDGMEFSPFKPGPFYPYNVFARVYQYDMTAFGGLPFYFNNLKIANGRVTATFEGNLYHSPAVSDMEHIPPVYLSEGVIDIPAKTTNN